MHLWTISAQPGTPGLEVAAELAARADVPLFDRRARPSISPIGSTRASWTTTSRPASAAA